MHLSFFRKRSLLSLRNVLITPYLLLVVVLATVLGVLSYRAGSDAVLRVSNHLLKETASRIDQAVDRHVIGSVATLEAAFPEGMVAPESIEMEMENLLTRFWIATSLHTDPNNYVYYGTVKGQAFGMYRLSDERVELRIKMAPGQRRSYYTMMGLAGQPVFEKKESKLFDPRQRPWFQAAQQHQQDIWTSVYIDFTTQDLVATRARRVLDQQGKLQGVVATDMPLKALNDFVSSLEVSPNGIAFIIEPDGKLIASSCSPNIKQDDDGAARRINAGQSENLFLREVYQELRPRLANKAAVRSEAFHFVDSKGETIHAAFSAFKDQAGLHWYNVVALPARDFMGGISQNVQQTILLGMLATLLVTLIGLAILNWVTRDLRKLAIAVNQVASGGHEDALTIRRNDEIGALAEDFTAMQQRLKTDHLTGLPNRHAFHQAIQSNLYNKGFTLLFIDINDFKEINDRYGHGMGDRVLKVVSKRMVQSVRQQDIVVRYGGDEFIILLEGTTRPEALAPIRAKIEAALGPPVEIDGHTIPLSGVAIGEAFATDPAVKLEDLLVEADKRMYVRKAEIKQQRRRPDS